MFTCVPRVFQRPYSERKEASCSSLKSGEKVSIKVHRFQRKNKSSAIQQDWRTKGTAGSMCHWLVGVQKGQRGGKGGGCCWTYAQSRWTSARQIGQVRLACEEPRRENKIRLMLLFLLSLTSCLSASVPKKRGSSLTLSHLSTHLAWNSWEHGNTLRSWRDSKSHMQTTHLEAQKKKKRLLTLSYSKQQKVGGGWGEAKTLTLFAPSDGCWSWTCMRGSARCRLWLTRAVWPLPDAQRGSAEPEKRHRGGS